jgi:hypothetical protein
MHGVILLNVILSNVILLNAILLNVTLLNVILLKDSKQNDFNHDTRQNEAFCRGVIRQNDRKQNVTK